MLCLWAYALTPDRGVPSEAQYMLADMVQLCGECFLHRGCHCAKAGCQSMLQDGSSQDHAATDKASGMCQ